METTTCKHDNQIRFHESAPPYCPDCNMYDWYDGKKLDGVDDLINMKPLFPLDWLAEKLGIVNNKIYLGNANANSHTIHRIVIANKIVNVKV